MRVIEWGQKLKPKRIPRASKNTEKIPGPKINPPKIPCRKFSSHKIFQKLYNRFCETDAMQCLTIVKIILNNCKTSLVVNFIRRTTRPGYAGTTTNLQIVLNTPKNLYLTRAPPPPPKKKYLPNFPTQKIPESKISNPDKSFDHPRHLKSGVSPLGNTFICGKCT